MTKNDILAGLSEIRVTPTTSTPMSVDYRLSCDRLAHVLTEIALDPEATRRFVAAMAAPRDEVQEGAVRFFGIAQEELVNAGELDEVTDF